MTTTVAEPFVEGLEGDEKTLDLAEDEVLIDHKAERALVSRHKRLYCRGSRKSGLAT